MKNSRKLYLCFALATLQFSIVFAQSKFDITNNQIEFRVQNPEAAVSNATGTPFIHGQFAPASVDEYEQQYMVRLNAVSGVLEFKHDSGQILVISNEEDHVIRMQDGTKRVYQTINLLDNRGLVQVLWSDAQGNALYLKEFVEFRPAREALNSYDVNQPAKYVRMDDEFYFKAEGQSTASKVPEKRKDFLKVFEKKETKDYLKDENINIKDREDLLKFFGYYFRK